MLQKWLLPSLSEILAQRENIGLDDKVAPQNGQAAVAENGYEGATNGKARSRASAQHSAAAAKAKREWKSAIVTLEQLLLQVITASDSDTDQENRSSLQGLVLAGPAAVLSHPDLLSRFQIGIFTHEAFNPLAWMPFQLPPAKTEQTQEIANSTYSLSLLPVDPLAQEQFCLVFTSNFSLVMVFGEEPIGTPAFRFSFDPEDIQQAWESLRPRMLLTNPHQLIQIEALVQKFLPKTPDYRIVMDFGRQLLKNLPEPPQAETIQTIPVTSTHPIAQPAKPQLNADSLKVGRHWEPLAKNEERNGSKISNLPEATPDVELLQALTHEIRTPLTTIRTLTKLLLKRRDLAPEVIRRLEIIDHECTEQINRMELIFRAVELETTAAKQAPVSLTSMPLEQVFQQSIPCWQKQAERRNLTLDVVLPQKLPTVVSHPAMLDQVLTGLMENFTRSLPAGSHIQVQVTPAGDQLKLQFLSQSNSHKTGNSTVSADSTYPTLKSVGQLLMFQPETGSLCLNLNVTKHLFQALGGKLIVRQRPQEGEVMTIFLPIEVSNPGLDNLVDERSIFC
ncbi:MAG: HAMP domain-containing histidine kinase [Coleofasciculus sp. Co-bin14]|nr:HAMP domain-containing histidine kinase [Coleofasciculus sp. Co-bin14]